MPAPSYMRFYPAAYCRGTINLTLEEQGTYMRLLCLMWANGGRIENNDAHIARSLPINLNKWLKVKPQILPYLEEHSPGYLTQKKLRVEYAFSSANKKETKLDAGGVTPHATPLVTPPVAPLAARGATPHVNNACGKNAAAQKAEENRRVSYLPEGGVAYMLARALDQSKSRSDKNKNFRLLEDGADPSCGQLHSDPLAARFVLDVVALFEKHSLHPPADYEVVKGWIDNGCDLNLHVLPAVEAVLSSRTGSATDPPHSWKYFAHEAYARKKPNREKNDG